MRKVRPYKDKELLDRVESLSTFTGWKKGIYDIWVRSSEDTFNAFDDAVFTFECLKDGEKPKFIMVCTGTSNAGAQGLKNFEQYNQFGCAVLKSDIIMYGSHIYGLHKRKVPAYVQAKGFPYFRDNDKDDKAEEIGKEYNNIIGANCHPAGENSIKIDGWSTACLVRNNKKQYNLWLAYMNKRPLSVCILKEF